MSHQDAKVLQKCSTVTLWRHTVTRVYVQQCVLSLYYGTFDQYLGFIIKVQSWKDLKPIFKIRHDVTSHRDKVIRTKKQGVPRIVQQFKFDICNQYLCFYIDLTS